MKNYDQAWRRLTAAARDASDDRNTESPYGFATRVAAMALGRPLVNPRALFEKFAMRGLIAAGVFSLAAVAFGYSSWLNEREEEVVTGDTVSEILAQS
ncbi:MAG TPA: hypothetical protein VFJ90_07020 [Candidatus Didemnitutus sp.]|nr:hypothetical protein [Candidatus Didemnitutus sp.]